MLKKRAHARWILCLVIFLLVPSLSVLAAPKIDLLGTNLQKMEAGKSGSFSVSLKNNGDRKALKMSVSVISSNLAACNVTSAGSEIDIGGSNVVFLEAEAPSTSGSYAVTLYISYEYGTGEQGSSEVTFPVEVTGSSSTGSKTADPVIVLQRPTGIVNMKKGESEEITLEIYNNSMGAGRNFVLTTVPNENVSVQLEAAAATPSIISGRSSKTLKATISTPRDLKAGSYPVKFTYRTENADKHAITGELSFYIRIEDDDAAGKPNIILKNFKANPAKAGESFEVSAEVVNTGAVKASSVQVALLGLESDKISIYNASGSTFYNNIDSNKTETFKTMLRYSSKIEDGSHPIKMKVSWQDDKNEAHEVEYTFYVTALGGAAEENRGMVSIQSLSTPQGQYNVGERANITMVIENRGQRTAKNIKIAADGGAAVVPSSASVLTVQTLAPGATRELTFSFAPNSDAQTQNYAIGFTIEYETGSFKEGEPIKDTFMQYTSMNAFNPKKDDEEDKQTSIPKIIVSQYKVEPEIVEAGKDFYLNIDFQNTHKNKSIANIRSTFTVKETETEKGNIFTPVDSSNMFYIENMEPKEISEHKLHLFTVPDAKPKNYVLNFVFEYEDEEGNPYESKMEVGINVAQPTQYELGEINVPEFSMVGMPEFLEFSILNTGKVDISNLKITLEGDKLDTIGSEYIFGTLKAGADDYYQGEFTPAEMGETTLKIHVSYHTGTGEKIEETYEYSMNIEAGAPTDIGMNPDGGEFPGEPGEIDETKVFIGSLWFWVAVGGGIALAAVVVVLVYRSNKRKKEMALDEDL